MKNFTTAIKRPFQDLKTFLIGIIIGAMPVVNLLIIGFALRNAKKSLEGDDSLLPWGNWSDIIVKTLSSILIAIVYVIPVIVIAFLLVGIRFLLYLEMFLYVCLYVSIIPIFSTIPIFVSPVFLAWEFLFAYVQNFIIGYIFFPIIFILPMAIMNWLKKGRIKAAFQLGSILKKCFTGTYILAWILISIILLIVSLFAIGLYIINPVIIYFISIAIFTLFAQAYRELEQRTISA